MKGRQAFDVNFMCIFLYPNSMPLSMPYHLSYLGEWIQQILALNPLALIRRENPEEPNITTRPLQPV